MSRTKQFFVICTRGYGWAARCGDEERRFSSSIAADAYTKYRNLGYSHEEAMNSPVLPHLPKGDTVRDCDNAAWHWNNASR